MKTLLWRGVVMARRRVELAESARRSYQRRLDHDLNAIMGLAPTNQHGKPAAKTLRPEPKPLVHLPGHPDTPPDNNVSEPELRPCNVPQGNRWLSVKLGRRFVRRHQIRCRHSHPTWLRCSSSNSCNSRWRFSVSGRWSSYDPAVFSGSRVTGVYLLEVWNSCADWLCYSELTLTIFRLAGVESNVIKRRIRG
jgi:hypothetical protein